MPLGKGAILAGALSALFAACSTPTSRPGPAASFALALERGDFTLLQESCAAGERAACTRRGELLLNQGDPRGALPEFEKGCGHGDPRACLQAGEVLFYQGARPAALRHFAVSCRAGLRRGCFLEARVALLAGESRRAKVILHANCAGRHGESCLWLGKLNERAGDAAGASRYYESACEKGVISACSELARRRLLGSPDADVEALFQHDCRSGLALSCRSNRVQQKLQSDAKLYERLRADCRRDSFPEDCYELGLAERLRDPDLAVSRASFEVACRKAHGPSCWELACSDFSQDEFASYAKLAAKACQLGTLEACAHLGSQPVLLPPGESQELLVKACRGGEGSACLALGDREFAAGRLGVAREQFGRACELDDHRGCVRQGRALIKEGRREQAALVLGISCGSEHAESCLELGLLYKDGLDKGEVKNFLKKGCDRRSKESCYWLSRVAMEWRLDPPENPAVMRAAYREFCDQGIAAACMSLARAFIEAQRSPEAISAYEAGCAVGDGEACRRAGKSREACDLGDIEGCRALRATGGRR
ncbi:MAG: hypothetical protein NDJ89_03590 [Oligoflexia bacterium]|nr:hypothetical protein [Oligoflexia bacterium]